MLECSTPDVGLLERFKNKVIGHPRLLDAHKSVMDLLKEPAGSSVAVVMGPTGVGKTTLFNRLKTDLLNVNARQVEAQPGLIPVVAVEAPSSETGSFNWREFYIRILAALYEPAVDYEVGIIETNGGKPRICRLSSLSLTELRRFVEASFRKRGVRFLLVDEAQHLRKMTSGRRLHDQMDALKSLASLSGAFVALIGTYELKAVVELNGQLARRCTSIQFSRYRYDDPRDLAHFRSVVATFASALGLDRHELLERTDYLYRGCAGCVGILKNWLTQALAHALAAGRGSLTEKDLAKTMLPTSALMKIAEEINEGEDHWARSHAPNSQLDKWLGMVPVGGGGPEKPRVEARPRSPVGVRKPTRDPVETMR